MMSKMKCFGVLAGCALATGALYAAPAYQQTFDGSTTLPEKWTGGTVTAGSNYTFSAMSTAGLPLTNPLPDPNNVLVIEGNTEYAHGSAIGSGGAPLVDMMVQTARPDDELGFPSSETTDTIQIAVAVDSNGCFNAYCQKKDNTVGWCKLSNTQYDATGWARVSFLFDYTNTPKRCQIRINGEPVMSPFGYLTASTSDGTADGAWYNLANAGSGVTSMKVIGCTAIDEVALYADSATYPLAGVSDASGVPYAWYDQYGISWDASGEYDTSDMTAAEKFNACLSPFDGQKFEIKSVGVKDVSGTKTVTVAVPTPDAMRTDRQLVVEYSTDSSFATSTTTVPVPANATSVDITAPAGGSTVYYRLKAVDL